jgi:hypothetical protein
MTCPQCGMSIPANADTCLQCGSDLTPVGRLRGFPFRLFGAVLVSLAGYAIYLAIYATSREEWMSVVLCSIGGIGFLGVGLWFIAHASTDR